MGESRIGAFEKPRKRSPLKDMPLRNPGESLEQERQRVLSDELMPPVLVFALSAAFASYEWFRSLFSVPPQPIGVSLVALIAVVYAFYKSLRLRGRMRALKLGVDGEKTVGQILEASRKPGWHVLHDLPGTGFNVDHVLLAPQGVFVIETKTFSKPGRGKAAARLDGDRLLVDGLKPERDAIKQARALRDWIRDLLLETTGIRYPVRGVVVLPGWFVDPPKDRRPDDIWVLNPKALPAFIEHERAQIEEEDVALAHARLSDHVTRGWAG